MTAGDKTILDEIYNKFNHKRYVWPDPLQFLYPYENLQDREIVGLVAALLAYGRVAQIVNSVSWVVDRMGPSPFEFLFTSKTGDLTEIFSGFAHRFAKTNHLVGLLSGIQYVLSRHGTIHSCFLAHDRPEESNIFAALNGLAKELRRGANKDPAHLLPLPERGSAAKRLHLFLRWMVRQDAVDPGGWTGVCPSRLIVPLDVHMHTICRKMGFTARRDAGLKTALDITSRFKQISPGDPVKYDFSLTRLGIRKDADTKDFFSQAITNPLT